MLTYQSCRFCKRPEGQVVGPLFKYAVRHYICAECFIAKKWDFKRLTSWQLEQFPALLVIEAGRYDEMKAAVHASK